jgi:hypothetical protein
MSAGQFDRSPISKNLYLFCRAEHALFNRHPTPAHRQAAETALAALPEARLRSLRLAPVTY